MARINNKKFQYSIDSVREAFVFNSDIEDSEVIYRAYKLDRVKLWMSLKPDIKDIVMRFLENSLR